MSVHPLSLRKQLLYTFPDVQNVRFEFLGYTIFFRVQLKDGTSGHLNTKLQKYLEDHRALGTHTVLADWQDGPIWPAFFDSLTEEQRVLAEACDSTKDSIEAVTIQAFEEIRAAQCETVAAGALKVVIQLKDGIATAKQLDLYRDFILASVPSPGVTAKVSAGYITPESNPPFSIPFIQNQASRVGINDKILLAKADQDEDLFREIRRNGFPAPTFDLLRPNLQGKRTIYFPMEHNELDIKAFLPLYDAVYFPIEVLINNTESIYGIKREEVFDLINRNLLIPVVAQRLGHYDQNLLREVLDAGYAVMPRLLAACVAAQMLTANPLWRVALSDSALVKTHLDILRRDISSEAGSPEYARTFVSRWIDFQTAGALDLTSGAINDAGLLPLRFGPGAFLSDVIMDKDGNSGKGMGLILAGFQVSHSMALYATCVPPIKKELYPLYELLALFSGAREAKERDKALQQLPVVAQLDEILKRLRISCPDGVSILEWIKIANPYMVDIRNSLETALRTGTIETLEGVSRSADKLERDLDQLAKGNQRTIKAAGTYEVVGLIADTITCTYLSDVKFPYMGTVIGVVLKRLFPRLWEMLGKNSTSQQMRDMLEASNSFVHPHVVRLHRAIKGLTKEIE